MKRHLAMICGALVLAMQVPCHAATKPHPLVGGPCTYDAFPGTCTATSVDDQGKTHFTFTGKVNKKQLVLKDNKAAESFAVGSSKDCALKFITSGTCTPCLLSIGECGREGFEALGNRQRE